VNDDELTTDLDLPGDIVTVLANGKPGRTRDTLLELDAITRLTARA
jgi:hypothetical protein